MKRRITNPRDSDSLSQLEKQIEECDNPQFMDKSERRSHVPRLFRVTSTKSLDSLRSYYMQAEENLRESHPLVGLFLDFHGSIELVTYLNNLLNWARMVDTQLSRWKSRKEASKPLIEELIGDDMEREVLENAFKSFQTSWEKIRPSVIKAGYAEMPHITRMSPISLSLVEKKDDGKYLCSALKILQGIQNDFVVNVLVIAVSGKCGALTFLERGESIASVRMVHLQDAQKKQIIHYQWSNEILTHSQHNTEYGQDSATEGIYDMYRKELPSYIRDQMLGIAGYCIAGPGDISLAWVTTALKRFIFRYVSSEEMRPDPVLPLLAHMLGTSLWLMEIMTERKRLREEQWKHAVKSILPEVLTLGQIHVVLNLCQNQLEKPLSNLDISYSLSVTASDSLYISIIPLQSLLALITEVLARNNMRRENRLVLVFFYVCMELAVLVSGAIVYPSLHWTFQNPLFKGGNYRLNVLPGSKLNILCPHVAVSLEERQDTDNGLIYENFWRVDLKSYETCNVNSSITKNKIFLQCDNPRQIQFETLVFQPFNADPSRVFKKGTVYYFIYANCTDTKPTTKPAQHAFALQNFIQSTTSAPSTVRVEMTEFTSTKQTSPPQTNSTETELPPDETEFVDQPDVGASKGQRESPSSTNGKHHCMHRSF
ncbi:hypothetical protein AWC38_SpisGene17332 [Stylophora pistillata]|uniref:Ephrin RBD domain-containing protein n=1 Tax=Stylophora pistillata TaxID=50429 RepID=A0A2B4RPR0_STYPI|nr:hypothetical protein AWC38_SpisGene17332 [Stylophora pistillata]